MFKAWGGAKFGVADMVVLRRVDRPAPKSTHPRCADEASIDWLLGGSLAWRGSTCVGSGMALKQGTRYIAANAWQSFAVLNSFGVHPIA
ncbi:hypothetical protein [Mesorhizobium prunaredense]|uniref:hypothetical protein n=1 Tax=Mesorhizobium prunaredense TaxID=1631249 RepID=UPI0011806311|nr:hypothetical protein [Mesorhizobium prunaredense]